MQNISQATDYELFNSEEVVSDEEYYIASMELSDEEYAEFEKDVADYYRMRRRWGWLFTAIYYVKKCFSFFK